MPCWLTQATPIEFGPNTKKELLAEALTNLGFIVNGDGYSRNRGYEFSADYFGNEMGGRMSFVIRKDGTAAIGYARSSQPVPVEVHNRIGREYSRVIVQHTAKKFGWQLKEKSPTQFAAMRRY